MIRLEDIQIGYGNHIVASGDADIAFAKAKLITLIGANGTGKSTLLRAITSGNHLIKGNIYINGVNTLNINGLKKSKSISTVVTQREFSHFLTVKEILCLSRAPYTSFMGKLRVQDHNIVHEAMEHFNITDLQHNRLGTLSDGQLQRVLIARALVQETDYVFMDEPTSFLDINHKADILLKLKKYAHNHHKCIVFSSHELSLSLSMADQVITIHNKQITQHDKVDFINSTMLQEMFPSHLIEFNAGEVRFLES